ncbi:MAG TPA: Glu/Leu/Phe/Val dehydrogenase dimerization domain-containing protein [Solirubrobacteraceae bacterium]|nr:Glu/Leu/Phe/Val dehydrogenase dimerization domain-containing protein [Solirubrobacteraceae bacterium]
MPDFQQLLDTWDGETAVIRRDRETGGWIFICIHSTRRGPAGGGTRMKVYGSPAEGLNDAMRLSGAMSRKLAVAGLPFGGGKAVIAIPEIPTGQPRRELLLRYGELVASLGGTYCTSSDMNTDEADLDVIWERTKYVFGRSVATGGSGSPARPTALGVFHGIRASVAHRDGSDELQGRRILIQGAGGVGSQLADHLAGAGASILVADLDQARAQAVASRVNGHVIQPDDVLETDADVYAPCAVGGTLDSQSASRLRCAIVAGSANNQLAQPEAADVLTARGILYAPDYVINAGGAIGVAGTEQLGWSQGQVNAALEKIGETLREVYRRSDEQGISTAAAAEALAEERLSESPEDPG